MAGRAEAALEAAFRDEWGELLAALIKYTRDWDLAEECVQEAFSKAARRWASGPLPTNPGAWLMTVARNRAIDRLRARARHRAKLPALAASETTTAVPDTAEEVRTTLRDFDDARVPDERLELIFTCCHPALPLEARVALTLRSLAGLTTAEIAHAFLVPEPTMAKRLVRSKDKIQSARIPFRVPPPDLLPERLPGVLAVVYLLFNEGYSASAGVDLVRRQLCDEAVRLGRVLAQLMPGEPEVIGLLALMVLQRSCQRARIAACHARAVDARRTDWAEIPRLYGRLLRFNSSAVVRLNLAVARAMSEGPEVGLQLVEELENSGELHGYHLLAATHADFLRRLGRTDEATVHYRRALAQAGSEPERRFLARRLEELSG